jgi:predicted dehydrogenase
MSTLRIGLAGLGYWGKHYFRLVNESEESSLVAIYDIDSHRLAYWHRQCPEARVYTEAKEFLSCSLDGVIIATPASSHYSLVKSALEIGLPVLVEKPFTSTSQQAEELAILAEQRRLPLLVGHTYLFAEPIRFLRRCIQQGSIGQLHYINSWRLNLGAIRHDCSVLWDLAVHDVAILLYLLEDRPTFIAAHQASRHPGGRADHAIVRLDFEQGVSAAIQVSWFWPEKVRSLTLIGSLAAAHYNDLNAQSPVRLYVWKPLSESSSVIPEIPPCDYTVITPSLPTSEPLRNLVKHYFECIQGRAKPISDAWFALEVIRILEEAERAALLAMGQRHGQQSPNYVQPVNTF